MGVLITVVSLGVLYGCALFLSSLIKDFFEVDQ